MEEMKVMLIMLGLIVGGVIAWIVYTNISNNVAKNSKNIAKKAEHIIKKDMSSKCARCTFYMNNDYDNGYSQSEWLKAFKESVIDKEWNKESEEYAEAVAPFINAIVIDDTNYYLRRGMQNMTHALEKFQPGVNDRISLNYFVEPYEYIEDEEAASEARARAASRKNSYSSYSRPAPAQPQKKPLSAFELAELRNARKSYESAVSAHKMHRNSSSAHHYESLEKQAFARLMSLEAKYAGRE